MKYFSLILASLCLSCNLLNAQILLSEDFNNGNIGAMSVINGGTSAHTWFLTTNGLNGNNLDGTEFMFVDSDAAGNSPDTILSEQLLSPIFNGNLYNQVFLEFDQFYRVYSGDSGFVEVFDGIQWQTLDAYNSDQGAWGNPDHRIYDLSPYLNPSLQIRFRYEDKAIWAWYWAVDNIEIYSPFTLDLGVVSSVLPSNSCGLGQAEILGLEIENTGIDTVFQFDASFQIDGGGTITESSNQTILPGDTLLYTFGTGANLSILGQHQILFMVQATGDGDPMNDSLAGNFIDSYANGPTLPWREDFESGANGWFSSGDNNSWELGFPGKTTISGASSGQSAWVTGGLGTDFHNDFEKSQVISPCFDLSQLTNPWVGLDIWWNSEWSWDGAALQISVDGGQTWSTIGLTGDPYNWYTDNSLGGEPGGQQEGWTGRASTNNGSGSYRRAVHSLANYTGSTEAIFRMSFGSDATVRDDGVAFDDFTLASPTLVSLGPDTSACDSFILDAGPASSYTWSTGDSSRQITVLSSGNYSVQILDSNGFPTGDQVQVDIYSTSNFDLGPDTLVCDSVLDLTADAAGQSYLWSTAASSSQIQVDSDGLYWAEVVYGPGCRVRDSVTIEFSDLLARMVVPDDTLCRGQLFQFRDSSDNALSYWWDFGDGNFSSNQNPNHIYTSGGSFSLSLEVSDGNCVTEVMQNIYVEICIGLEEEASVYLDIFPNPVEEVLWLRLKENVGGKGKVQILDMFGRKILESDWLFSGTGKLKLDLNGLAQGVYVVRISINKKWYRQQILKVK